VGCFYSRETQEGELHFYLGFRVLVNPEVNWKVSGMSSGFCGGCGGGDDDDDVSRVLIV
jgi:hypothetical protein